MSKYINTKRILSFVNRVERKKNYKRDVNLIMRHLFEEVGEVSAILYKFQSPDTPTLRDIKRRETALELVDVVFLSCYLAEALGVDLDGCVSDRMQAVARKYNVKCPEAKRGARA